MIRIAVLATLVAAAQAAAQPPTTPPPDTSGPRNISVQIGNRKIARKVIPLTPELEASAFRDGNARGLIARARSARAVQDSLLQSYEAISRLRVSVGAKVKVAGRERMFARIETVRRIRWQRGVGADVEVLGSRYVVPPVSPEVRPERNPSLAPSSIPYYPGREALWPMGELRDVMSEGGLWVHPLGTGAEAYYRYTTGDSIVYTLSDRSTIRLTEIRLTPRDPRWDLVAGSFWFDQASGQLVRAIYRPSIPMDMEMSVGGEENPARFGWLRPLVLTVRSVSVEFSLHEGRWWLPRRQSAEGEAQVTFARIATVMEQSFEYGSVNALAPLPPIVVDSAARSDTVLPDSIARRMTPEQRAARRDSLRAERERARRAECAASGGFARSTRWSDSVPVAIRIPCDSATLVNSAALPASIFGPGDDPLTVADVDMLERALGMASQAQWSPGKPTFHYGIDLVRYNRVEGLSVGAELREEFGAGFSGRLIGRLGVADLHPRGELLLARSDAHRTVGVGAYERLGVANDWGAPLDFGASLNALLFGRDEGLYYRATGVELAGRGLAGSLFSWRVFGERHRSVDVETHFSLPHAINGFRFRENIVAERADLLGAGVRFQGSRGLDPERFRALGDLRVEGATGDFDYARAMLELTLSRGLFGRVQASLTGAGGTSRGALPVQRLWYLGGVHTVRGQPIAAAAGDAFWMGRAELGFSAPVVRPAVFLDLGWAGDRHDWRHPGRPLSGAGVGMSVLDGLLRLDVAKGLRPNRGVRVDLTLEARF